MTSAIAEMSEIVRAAAEPWSAGDSVKAGINRASRRLGISPRRAITFWYGRQCAVLAHEADRLRAWHADWCRREIERHKREIEELQARDAALGERLHALATARARVSVGSDDAAISRKLVRETG
jgi:hypothetical protein